MVSTPLGLMYRSDRGIELLDRSLTVVPIGADIQDTLDAYPEVMAATVVPHQDVVIFECCESVSGGQASGNGVSLVFDLTIKGWVSIDKKRISGAATSHPAQDACVLLYNGRERYAWVDTSGRVYVESDDYLESDGTMVVKTWESAWLKSAGLSGEQQVDKVIVLGERHTSHGLSVSLGYDYASAYTHTRSFSDGELDALARQWVDVATGKNRRGQAIRVKLVDATPSVGTLGSGRGGTWLGLTFEGEPRPGGKRTATGQR